MHQSEENTLNPTHLAKFADCQQRIFTTKKEGAKISATKIRSWPFVGNAIIVLSKILHGLGRKDI